MPVLLLQKHLFSKLQAFIIAAFISFSENPLVFNAGKSIFGIP